MLLKYVFGSPMCVLLQEPGHIWRSYWNSNQFIRWLYLRCIRSGYVFIRRDDQHKDYLNYVRKFGASIRQITLRQLSCEQKYRATQQSLLYCCPNARVLSITESTFNNCSYYALPTALTELHLHNCYDDYQLPPTGITHTRQLKALTLHMSNGSNTAVQFLKMCAPACLEQLSLKIKDAGFYFRKMEEKAEEEEDDGDDEDDDDASSVESTVFDESEVPVLDQLVLILPQCTRLVALQLLSMRGMDDTDVIEIVRICPQLQHLSLQGCSSVKDRCADVICQLKNLKTLNIVGTKCSDAFLDHLAQYRASTLTGLYICSTNKTTASLNRLLQVCVHLVVLGLKFDEEFTFDSTYMGNIRSLQIDALYCTGADTLPLSLQHCSKLQHLSLGHVHSCYSHLPTLLNTRHVPALLKVNLFGSTSSYRIDDMGYAAFKLLRPDVNCSWSESGCGRYSFHEIAQGTSY